MNTFFVVLYVLFYVSLSKCETPSCKTNCLTDEECWQNALAYRSKELIDQLFLFSSLAVHVDTYQRSHASEVNDSIAFIDKSLEDRLADELVNSSLTMDLFTDTKQILIEFCTNLTSVPIDAVNRLPPLFCSLSTCSSETMNFMVMLIISALISSIILLLCGLQSFQTYHQAKPLRTTPRSISFMNPYLINDLNVEINSNRF